MRLFSTFPFVFLILATRSDAAHLGLSGQLGSTSPDLQQRTPLTGTKLSDSQNLWYSTNVTLNGKQFSILIDIWSSDFWVCSPIPSAVSQGYQANISYVSGSASGNVMSATLDFAGFSVDSQFVLEAPNASPAGGADGLIGLGPGSGSNIRALGNSSAANPPLDRIFTSNSSISPLIAILLQRSNDPDEPYPGDLAIGEVLTDYQDILDQPGLPVMLASHQGDQHWQTLLDANGIIGPDGKPIEIKTQVTGAQTQNATVTFDMRYPLSQVPPNVARALYGEIPGAALKNVSNLGEVWTLPCGAEVNATFLFGGVEFPIHPLDLNFDGIGLVLNGKPTCVGAFQPAVLVDEQNNILSDMILGAAFLRNSYLLINFGNLLDGATPSTDTAYIQLLPVTNATQAAQDFASARKINGSISNSPLWLIGLVVGIPLLALFVTAIVYCYRRRAKNALSPSIAVEANEPYYRPIHEPSPQPAYDIYMARAWM